MKFTSYRSTCTAKAPWPFGIFGPGIPGPDLHCAGPLALRGFLQQLPAKYKYINEDQNKVLLSEGRTLALYHMANAALVIALRS